MTDPNACLDYDDMCRSSEIRRLAKLADDLERKQRLVTRIECRLKRAQQAVKDLSEGMIPELMEELGLETFRTKSGFEVEIVKHVHASISKENAPRAHDWFDKHGEGGMIKRNVVVAFNRDQTEAARKLLGDLRAAGYPGVKEEQAIHPSTLKAWVTRRLEAGQEVPDSVTTHVVNIAEIQKP